MVWRDLSGEPGFHDHANTANPDCTPNLPSSEATFDVAWGVSNASVSR
jgi:hypothetical protein